MDIVYWAAGAFAGGVGVFVSGWGHGLHILLVEGLDLPGNDECFFLSWYQMNAVESWWLWEGLLQNLECTDT